MLEKIYEELDGSRNVLNILMREMLRKNKARIKQKDGFIVLSMRYIPTEIQTTLTRIGYLLKRPIPESNLQMYTDMKYLYIYLKQ